MVFIVVVKIILFLSMVVKFTLLYFALNTDKVIRLKKKAVKFIADLRSDRRIYSTTNLILTSEIHIGYAHL